MVDLEKLFSPDPALVEKLVRKNKIYAGKSVDFYVDEVELPDGAKATREYLDHPGAVGVVPVHPDGRIVLVRQYRYPVGEVTLELPAGKLHKGEDPLECVKRELQEETGYTAARFTTLVDYWPTPAFANEVLHLYVAEGLTPGPIAPDEDEFIEKVELPLDDILALCRDGRIKDSKTLVGLLAFAAWRRTQ